MLTLVSLHTRALGPSSATATSQPGDSVQSWILQLIWTPQQGQEQCPGVAVCLQGGCSSSGHAVMGSGWKSPLRPPAPIIPGMEPWPGHCPAAPAVPGLAEAGDTGDNSLSPHSCSNPAWNHCTAQQGIVSLTSSKADTTKLPGFNSLSQLVRREMPTLSSAPAAPDLPPPCPSCHFLLLKQGFQLQLLTPTPAWPKELSALCCPSA